MPARLYIGDFKVKPRIRLNTSITAKDWPPLAVSSRKYHVWAGCCFQPAHGKYPAPVPALASAHNIVLVPLSTLP